MLTLGWWKNWKPLKTIVGGHHSDLIFRIFVCFVSCLPKSFRCLCIHPVILSPYHPGASVRSTPHHFLTLRLLWSVLLFWILTHRCRVLSSWPLSSSLLLWTFRVPFLIGLFQFCSRDLWSSQPFSYQVLLMPPLDTLLRLAWKDGTSRNHPFGWKPLLLGYCNIHYIDKRISYPGLSFAP